MRQITLSGAGFDKYRKETRKERFLDNMEKIIPWKEPADALGPCYPNPKGAGRRRIGVERMLRIHFLQHGWFSLPDPAVGRLPFEVFPDFLDLLVGGFQHERLPR